MTFWVLVLTMFLVGLVTAIREIGRDGDGAAVGYGVGCGYIGASLLFSIAKIFGLL